MMKTRFLLLGVLLFFATVNAQFFPDGATSATSATSCVDILNYYRSSPVFANSRLQDAYWFKDSSTTPETYYKAHCDSQGWQLVMKLSGSSSTFQYSSSYWTNTATLNPTSGSEGEQIEAKLASYYLIPLNEMKLTFQIDSTSISGGALTTRSLTVGSPNNNTFASMQDMISTTAPWTPFGYGRTKDEWMTLAGSFPLMQLYCNDQGVNMVSSTQTSIRLGILSNDQNHCASPDSMIGIGNSGLNTGAGIIKAYHGNIANGNYGPFTNGVAWHNNNLPTFVWLLVRRFFDCSGVNFCSGRGLCTGTNICTCNAGYAGPSCQFTYCFGVASNDTTVCSGRGICAAPDVCVCTQGHASTTGNTLTRNCDGPRIQVGDGSLAKPAASCREAWNTLKSRGLTPASGQYTLHTSTLPLASNLRTAYCDMSDGSELILKVTGFSTNFRYYSPRWVDDVTFGAVDLSQADGKYLGYFYSAFNQIQFKVGSTTLSRGTTYSTLYAFMRNDHYTAFSTNAPTGWAGLIGGSALNSNCQIEGFNLKSPNGQSVQLRMGAFSNTDSNCAASGEIGYIGIGAGGDTTLTNNVAAGYRQTKSPGGTGAFVQVFVRETFDCSTLNYCSGSGRCTANAKCTCDDGYSGTNCAVPLCGGKAATDGSVCTGRGTCTAPDTCVCNSGYGGQFCQFFSFEGAQYMAYNYQVLYGTAASNCKNVNGFNGYLISVHTATANTAVRNWLNSLGIGAVWMGFGDGAVEGTFTWADRTSVTYTNWAAGEPNNSGTGEDCSAMGTNGLWNDVPCTGARAYVCKQVVCNGKYGVEPTVCNGRGVCRSQDLCELCSNGWTGNDCEIPTCQSIAATSNTVCLARGNCTAPDTCACVSGWTGNNCQTPICNNIPATSGSVCSGKGTCTAPNTCSCSSGYTGTNCEIPVCAGLAATNSNVCSKRGTCAAPDSCNCIAGWTGSNCEVPICDSIPATSSSVCSQRGTCTNVNTCVCNQGWVGTICQTPTCNGTAATSSQVCSGRGTCTAPNVCSCNTGYGNTYCQSPVCGGILSTSGSVCSGRGTCTAPNTCVCTSGYQGSNCEVPICFGTPATTGSVCSGRGTCTSPNTCVCNAGWTDNTCQSAICNGIAASNATVCSQRGTCKAPDSCSCNVGYTSQFCAFPLCDGIAANSPSVCSGRGTCTAPNNCQCPNTHTGSSCQTPICSGIAATNSSVCSGRGTCTEPDVCVCPDQWRGSICQYPVCFNITSTSSAVCSGNGQCLAPNSCNCSSVWSGSNCEIPKCSGIPADSPAVCSNSNGTCVAPNTCNCTAGYTGANCEIPICFNVTADKSSACSGHGSCVRYDSCICEENYTGDQCQYASCYGLFANNPKVCSSNGLCVGVNNCTCFDGFYGSACENLNIAGVKYKVFRTPATWSDASQKCKSEFDGGELAGFITESEYDKVFAYSTHIVDDSSVWMGMNRGPSGSFANADGLSIKFYRWDDSEPSQVDEQGNPENCIAYSPSGKWSDLVCARTLPFICKQYQCFGKNHTDPTACSSNGFCLVQDICSCNEGWKGDRCDRDDSSRFCPFGQYSNLLFDTALYQVSSNITINSAEDRIGLKQSTYYLVFLQQEQYVAKRGTSDDSHLWEFKLKASGCQISTVFSTVNDIIAAGVTCQHECCSGHTLQQDYCTGACASWNTNAVATINKGVTVLFFNVSDGSYISQSYVNSTGSLVSVDLGSAGMLLSIMDTASSQVGTLYSYHVESSTYVLSWYKRMKNVNNIHAIQSSNMIVTTGQFGQESLVAPIELFDINGTLFEKKQLSELPVRVAAKHIVFHHLNGSTESVNLMIGSLQFIASFMSQRYELTRVLHDASGNIFIAGYTSIPFFVGSKTIPAPYCCTAYVIKMDRVGNILWTRAFTPSANKNQAQALDLRLDIYGNAYLVFQIRSNYFSKDALIPFNPSFGSGIVVTKLIAQTGELVFNDVILLQTSQVTALTCDVLTTGDIKVFFKSNSSSQIVFGSKGLSTNSTSGLFMVKYPHTCASCSSGQYLVDANSVSSKACKSCEPGTYTSVPGAACTPCPAGTYNPSTGSTSIDSCLPCPAGTFSASSGSSSISQCLPCRSGFFSDRPGASFCTRCPVDGSSQPGSLFCQQCEQGKYANVNGTRYGMDIGISEVQYLTSISDKPVVIRNSGSRSELLAFNTTLQLNTTTVLDAYHTVSAKLFDQKILVAGYLPANNLAVEYRLLEYFNDTFTTVHQWQCTLNQQPSKLISTMDTLGNLYAVFDTATSIKCMQSTIAQPRYTLIKMNSTSVEWAIQFASSTNDVDIVALEIDNIGSVVMAGQYSGDAMILGKAVSAARNDFFIAKLAQNGTSYSLAFLITNANNPFIQLKSLLIDGSNGDIYIAGNYEGSNTLKGSTSHQMALNSNGFSKNGFVAKYLTTGQIAYALSFGGSNPDGMASVNSLFMDSFKNLFLIGYLTHSMTIGNKLLQSVGMSDLFQAKIDYQGTVVWATSGGTSLSDDLYFATFSNNKPWMLAGFYDTQIMYPSVMLGNTYSSLEQLFMFVTSCEACPVGTYSSAIGAVDVSTCVACPAGFYSNQTGLSSLSQCVSCPVGTWQNKPGSSSCIPCPQGSFLAATGSSTQACTLCPKGTFGVREGSGSVTECVKCPVGRFGTIDGATSISQCEKCSPGYFADAEGATQCSPCPLGTYFSGVEASSSQNCTKCPAGKYSLRLGATMESDCTLCDAGKYNPKEGSSTEKDCLHCPPGFVSNEFGAKSNESCTACPKGQYSNEERTACLRCPAGTYNSFSGQSSVESCFKCPKGTYSPATGLTSEEDCQKCGKGSYGTIEGATNENACAECPSGTYSNITGAPSSSYCYPCPKGSYSFSNSSECIKCPSGKYSSLVNATSDEVCKPCPSGYYGAEPGLTSIDLCTACQVGTWSSSEGANSSATCNKCGRGTYSTVVGSSSSDSCLSCPPGTFSNITGAGNISACTQCLPGTWSAGGVESCTKCNAGTYSPNYGSTSQASCIECAAGYYSNVVGASSNATCLPCPAGSFSSVAGATNQGQCQLCPAGTYSITEGSNSELNCVPCPKGYYNSNPGASSFLSCQPCPIGTYSEELGASSFTKCKNCTRGTYGVAEAANSSSSCLSCPAGTFGQLSGLSSIDQCEKCPEGTYLSTAGGISVADCVPCPMGSYSNTSGSTSLDSCLKCPAGTWSDKLGLRDINQCNRCRKGKYSDAIGAASESICKNCPVGTYGNSAGATSESTGCSPCPAGTFNAEPGIDGEQLCVPCPAGSYSNMTGLTREESCQLCPLGTFCNQTRSTSVFDCKPCPEGTWGSEPGGTDESVCLACPSGTYSSILGAKSRTECLKCPPGTYSNVAGVTTIDNCIKCPAGTYNPDFGAADVTQCLLCPNGTYSETVGMTQIERCIPCPVGNYGPLPGLKSPLECLPCPRGSYSSVTGISSDKQCTKCPAGTYLDFQGAQGLGDCRPCPGGTASSMVGLTTIDGCQACPSGSYSAGRASECSTCPAGYFTNNSSQSSCQACPPGFYQSQNGSTLCNPCIPGSFASANGSVSCAPCPSGTYVDTPQAPACLACPAGFFCGLAAVKPIANDIRNASIVAIDPYSINAIANFATVNVTVGRALTPTEWRVIVVAMGVAVGLTVLVPVLILFIIHKLSQRAKRVHPKASAFVQFFYKIITSIDNFALKHLVRVGEAVKNTPTFLGGTLTLLYLVAILTVIALSIIDVRFTNVFDKTFIAPESVLDKEISKDIKGNYTIKLELLNFMGTTCDQTNANPLITGIEPKFLIDTQIFKHESTCYINVACPKCYLTGTTQNLEFSWTDPYATASLIKYEVSLPHFFKNNSEPDSGSSADGVGNTRFIIGEVIKPDSLDEIFSGPEPTLITLSLTKSFYTKLPVNYFFYSNDNITTRTTGGYIATRFPPRPGSVQSASTFAVVSQASASSKRTLGIEIELDLNPSIFRIEEESKILLLDFISKNIALITALGSIFALIITNLEKLFAGTKQVKNKAKTIINNHRKSVAAKSIEEQLTDTPSEATPKRPKSVKTENIELNDL